MQQLFCDGGVVRSNPSPVGGTWAWCRVEDDQIIESASGYIPATPEHPVTNNVSELWAAVHGIEALPADWSGQICSDSQITLGRLFQGWPLKGVPDDLCERLWHARWCLTKDMTPVLHQGHPTRADLECGIGKKRNLPVSRFNVWCDLACQEQARQLEKAA